MVKTFLLETFKVPKTLYGRLEAIPKPKSKRDKSKARKKSKSLLQPLIENRKNLESYSYVTFTADIWDDTKAEEFGNDLFEPEIKLLNELNPAFDARITVSFWKGTFKIEANSDPNWEKNIYMEMNQYGDNVYFVNNLHHVLILTEVKNIHDLTWAKHVLYNPGRSFKDMLDYQEALHIVSNSGEPFIFMEPNFD